MFTKQNLLATLTGFLVMFFLGYLIWGIATADFFDGHTLNDFSKDPPDMLFVAISNLVAAFVVSTLYGKWSGGNYGAKDGFVFGAWIGLFTGAGLGLLWYATANLMDLQGYLAEAVLEIIFYGIMGAAIGAVYKKTEPKAVVS